jgi:AcrR family transcriptional regulator
MVKPSGQPLADGTETRILDAADAVFVRRGTDGARMREIASEAGVNKALLHYYYRTKERLSEAVFKRATRNLIPAVFEVLGSDAPLEAKVDRVVETYLDQLSKRPYLPGYVIGELTHHPDRIVALIGALTNGAQRRAVRKLRGQIKKGIASGTVAPGTTAEQFLVTLIGSCIFPFATRPMISAVLDLSPRGFDRFTQTRREELPAFLKRALRP